MPEIKIYKSPWKAIKLILLPMPFVIFSFYNLFFSLSQDNHKTMDWICLCFFGLCLFMGLFNLFDTRPELILNNEGIFDRMSFSIFNKNKKKGSVAWSSIKDAEVIIQQNNYRGLPLSPQKFICLKLDKDAVRKLNNSATTHKISKAFGLGDFSFPLMNLKNFDEQKFITLIKAMAHADNVQRQKLLTEFKP